MKTLLITLLFSVLAFGHEGHDEGKTTAQAPKGGIIKKLEEGYIEVVVKKKDVSVYFYDAELKPADLNQYKVEAKAQRPRIKMTDNLTLVKKDNVATSQYDAQGAHRYTLILNVTFPGADHGDIVKFNVEPK